MKNYSYYVIRNKSHSSMRQAIAKFKTEKEAIKFIYENSLSGYTYWIERR